MENINFEDLMQVQFASAKFWWFLAALCGILVLLIDIAVTFTSQINILLAIITASLLVFNVLCLWRSDRLRDVAETMLRKYEMHQSLGWEISSREIANILASAPRQVKKAAHSTKKYTYFASTQNKGASKLLENLEESIWWTRHQAKRMSMYTGLLGIAVFFIAIATLVIFLQSTPSQTTSSIVAKVTISIIVFMFSGGYIRLAFDYNLFANQAQKIENRSYHLRQENNVSETEAINLLHEYQINRASSPLFPAWLWRIMSKELNELWESQMDSE